MATAQYDPETHAVAVQSTDEQAFRVDTKFIERQRLPKTYRAITPSFLTAVAEVLPPQLEHAPTQAVAKTFRGRPRMASTVRRPRPPGAAICRRPSKGRRRLTHDETSQRRRQRVSAGQRHLGGEILLPRSRHRPRRRVSFYGPTAKAVRDKMKAARDRLEAGAPVKDATRSVGDWLTHWRATTLAASDRKESTRALYANLSRRTSKPRRSVRSRWTGCEPSDVEALILALRGRGLSDSHGAVRSTPCCGPASTAPCATG